MVNFSQCTFCGLTMVTQAASYSIGPGTWTLNPGILCLAQYSHFSRHASMRDKSGEISYLYFSIQPVDGWIRSFLEIHFILKLKHSELYAESNDLFMDPLMWSCFQMMYESCGNINESLSHSNNEVYPNGIHLVIYVSNLIANGCLKDCLQLSLASCCFCLVIFLSKNRGTGL